MVGDVESRQGPGQEQRGDQREDMVRHAPIMLLMLLGFEADKWFMEALSDA